MNVRLTQEYAAFYRDEHLRRAEMRRVAASVPPVRTRRRRVVARDLYLHRGFQRLGTVVGGLFPA